jgi:hypothetical protein
MPKKTGAKGGIYLYAVVRGSEDRKLDVTGIHDGEVYMLAQDDLTAVVSDMSEVGKLRPERRHLAAHQRVLTHLVEEHDVVLPVAFGTVPESKKAVQDLLSRYKDDLIDQLQRVEGKVEMGLRVVIDAPNIFEYFVSKNSELKQARDEVFNSNNEPTREEKIDLGQKFESILSKNREECAKKVESTLAEYCSEIRQNRCRNEQELARVACLIEKDKTDVFVNAVSKAAEQFEDDYVFDYNGPVPPYNFVEVRIRA